jgi:hypothetical protein
MERLPEGFQGPGRFPGVGSLARLQKASKEALTALGHLGASKSPFVSIKVTRIF